MNLWSVGIWLMEGKAHHTLFLPSLLQFFCSPPIPMATTLASCFLPGLPATKHPKNTSSDFSWTQICHHCSDISCLFVYLNLAVRVTSQWVRAAKKLTKYSRTDQIKEEGHPTQCGWRDLRPVTINYLMINHHCGERRISPEPLETQYYTTHSVQIQQVTWR